MAATTSEFLARSGLEPGLVATIVLSALLHGGAVVLLITVPGRFLSAPTAPVSYTVDLVAPDTIGGTNLIPGKKAAPKMPAAPVAPAKVAEPKAPVAPAAPAMEPPPAAKVEPPPVPAAPKAAEPAQAEPAKVVEPPKPVAPPKPVDAPKPAEPAKPAEAAKPAAPAAPIKQQKPPPVAKPEPAPKPAVAEAKSAQPKPAEPKPAAKPAQAAKAPDKPPEPKTAKQTTEKPAPNAAKPAKPEAAPKAEAKAQPANLDRQIAEAIQRRAAQVQGQERAARQQVDQQIAAAVQRRAQQAQQGAGAAEPGGPISVGPGSGSGGKPADLQYILYQGRMEERIKAAWAWAGANKKLQAVIQFNLTPDGEIRNIRTIESSGDPQYDSSCERAVRAVGRLDPIPEKYREDFATVQMTFKPTDLQ